MLLIKLDFFYSLYGNYTNTIRYTYGEDLIGTSKAKEKFGDVSKVDKKKYNNSFYFLDEKGTPTKVTDQNGKVKGNYAFDEYGQSSARTILTGQLGCPIMFIDPSGYYTTIEGQNSHKALQLYFLTYYQAPFACKAYIEFPVNGLLHNRSLKGRADMVLDTGKVLEVYEIKPITYRYNEAGREQLQGYVVYRVVRLIPSLFPLMANFTSKCVLSITYNLER